MDWISSVQFAGYAGISQQRARKLCLEIENDDRLHWQGHTLEVRTTYGCGGASGRQYLVKVASLPQYLQDRLKASQTPFEGRLSRPLSDAARARTWWLHVLGSALEHPKGSSERKAALDAIAAVKQLDWHGRKITVSLRTLQRRLARMEGEASIRPLARSGRADKGQKRVLISRAWDNAVPLDDATKAKLAENLRQQIRGYLKEGTQPKELTVLAQRFLVKETRAWGFRPADPAVLERACRIPKHLVEAESVYRKVYRHKFDRKASEDDRPRVKRTIKGLRPMEIVVMDVHPIDVLVARSDGSTATPRLLGFLDLATGRMWSELVFLDKRGGVRNTDLIEAFTAMAMDAAFGLPETIYIDNGKEYLFADFLDDALKLAIPSVTADGKMRSSRIIRALPYNAAAKPIERLFGHIEQHYLRFAPGWIGGDRMKKKQQEIGKQVAPFGSFDAFKPYFFGLLNAYHKMPHTHGENKGNSPEQVFAQHVSGGWAATVMDPDNLLSVFMRPETRKVSGHAIQVDGRVWTGPALDAYVGDRVTVHVPAFHGFNELQVIGEDGRELGTVRPQEEFSYHDARGAQRSASRVKERNRAIRQLDRSTPDVDVGAELIAWGSEQPDILPNEPRGVVSVSGSASSRRAITPEGSPEADEKARQREQDEIRAIRRASAQAVRLREAG